MHPNHVIPEPEIEQEPEVAPACLSQPARGPSLKTLADVRRLARRLLADLVVPDREPVLSVEGYRIATGLLSVIRATIVDEQSQARADARALGENKPSGGRRKSVQPPPHPSNPPPGTDVGHPDVTPPGRIPARFIVPKA